MFETAGCYTRHHEENIGEL